MENLPKIVVKRLQSPVVDPHPDADLLTALADQSLAGAERNHVLEHLARCGDCREVVSLAVLPQLDVQPAAHNRENWLSWPLLRGPAWRWAAVAAGVVLIASIGVMQFRRQRASELAANVLPAKTSIVAPAPTDHSSLDATSQTRMQKDELAAPRAQTALAANQRARSVARQNPAPTARQTVSEASPAIEAQSEGAQIASQVTPRSQVEQSEVQDQLIQNKATEHSPAYANRVDKAKPAAPQGSLAMAPAPLLHTDPSLLKGFPAPRWIISSGGALQRSFDGGKTWLDVDVATKGSAMTAVEAKADSTPDAQLGGRAEEKKQADFKASQSVPATPPIFHALSVSSNAAEVWAGGSGGALYHTVDVGNSWARVLPSAAGRVLTGDVLSIQFSDPRNGTVTTSTAEVWTTPDDGQTWQKQP
ncbi:MAG: YCF48-related protein [Candidatus Sulfotelmatobacter sp.]